ncbi:MAG: pectate lyase [Planctomycetia bacterium]|nr:pectate lyase [Planctomycetia bacterium]
MLARSAFTLALILALTAFASAQDKPSADEVKAALQKSTKFFHTKIADHGGYAWVSSLDGKLREGEGVAGPGTIWVQPPGTPAVGMAFLDAYEVTGDELHLKAALDATRALVKGQLRSGGWNYRVEFDPAKRKAFIYRDSEKGSRQFIPKTPAPGGWDVWKKRQYKGDITTLDDDTTPAALRLLMRMDAALKFKDKEIHGAVEYALESLLNAQYPIGAWSHNYDCFPTQQPDVKHYPIKNASFPEKWSRTWTKDFTGCYMLNDRITQNVIATMLLAHRIYNDKKYLAAAEKGGKFLIAAQLPDPQPAWAQQYDRNMQPVWDRKFEPPAITGLESQDALDTLLLLYRETGDRKYLEPMPKALAYLKKCVLPNGKLARFYELQTNKPLYFTKDYKLTYDSDDVPTHYGFTFSSRLNSIEKEYKRLLALKPGESRELPPASPPSAEAVRKIIAAQSADGGWLEPGDVRDATGKKVTPKEGVVKSERFIHNVGVLNRYLKSTR